MEVGDKVWVKTFRAELIETTITKIGRKWVHVSYANKKFYRDILTQGGDYCGTPDKLYLRKEDHEEEVYILKLRLSIEKFIRNDSRELTKDQLERINAILEENK